MDAANFGLEIFHLVLQIKIPIVPHVGNSLFLLQLHLGVFKFLEGRGLVLFRSNQGGLQKKEPNPHANQHNNQNTDNRFHGKLLVVVGAANSRLN